MIFTFISNQDFLELEFMIKISTVLKVRAVEFLRN